jgi:hypothetical protein
MRRDPATGPLAAGTLQWALGSGFVGDGQLVPSLGPARSQDPAAVLGGHAQAEPVLVDALAIVRLKRTLHGEKLQRCSDKREECTCTPPLPSTGHRFRLISFRLHRGLVSTGVGLFLNWRWAVSQGLPGPGPKGHQARPFGIRRLRGGLPPPCTPAKGTADVAGNRKTRDLRTRLQAEAAWRRGCDAVFSGKWEKVLTRTRIQPNPLSCGVSRRG